MSATKKAKFPIDIFEVGEAAAVANVLQRVIMEGESAPIDAIARMSNISGDDLVYLAMSVSSQLNRMKKAMEAAENA